MAQPLERTAANDAPTRDEERPEPLSFTLQVVSPSVGVALPLVFPQLLATTSIKELKAKIRAVLPSQPSDENQRLIHRGRMLANEADTMINVFGRDTLQQPQSQTLHLVLRPTATDGPPPPMQPGTTLPIPQPGTTITMPLVPNPSGLPNLPQPRPDQTAPRVQATPLQMLAFHEAQRQEAIRRVEDTNQLLVQQLTHMQQQHHRLNQQLETFEERYRATLALMQNRTARAGQILNPAIAQAQLVQDQINQQQRERAAEGRLGVQDSAGFRAREDAATPLNEQAGPNGEHRHIATTVQAPIFRNQQHIDPNIHHHPPQENRLPYEHDWPNGEAPEQNQQRTRHMNAPRPDSPSANLISHLREQVGRNGDRQAGQDNTQPPFLRQRMNGHPGESGHVLQNGVRSHNVVTYVQEEIGPNGERTVVRHQIVNGHPVEPGHVLANGARYTHNPIPDLMAHVQARARAARSPQRMVGQVPGAMERSASNPTIGNPPVVQSVASAVTGTNTPTSHPSQYMHQPQHPIVGPTASTASLRNPSGAPTVYLLSSPSGPRALLVTNQDTFYSRSTRTEVRPANSYTSAVQGPARYPDNQNRQGRGGRRLVRQEGANPDVPIAAPHANPAAGALGARVLPLMWLVVRLVGFVWFFTSGNPSWSRWLMISGLAFAVFIFNTGIFNGIALDLWAPIRAHLEALIPLAGPDAALIPAQNAAPIPQVGPAPNANQRPRRGELDEHEVAAHLNEQRRQQNGWLMTHIRRVEHSLLLFMASLIPGVGERHIAAREAEANQRQRLIDEAAAAAAAEDEANAENETGGAENDPTGEESQPHEGEVAREDAPVPPLIDV